MANHNTDDIKYCLNKIIDKNSAEPDATKLNVDLIFLKHRQKLNKLFGAGGADVLIGGKGTNRYRYTDITDSLAGKDSQDSIYGFGNKDKINLRGLDAELRFIGADKFSGTAGDVRFHRETLQLDLDGDGTADFAIALPGTTKLKSSNLIL